MHVNAKLIYIDHGPSQSGPYSSVRDLLATFTLNFSLIAQGVLLLRVEGRME